MHHHSIEEYSKKCIEKVTFHNEQARRCRNWNTWLNLFNTSISAIQIITMSIIAIDSVIYSVSTIAIVSAVFGFINVLVLQTKNSYSFDGLASINDNISENFNELNIEFLLLDPEKPNYVIDLEKCIIKLVSLENKIHPVTVNKCRSILCCMN